MNSLQMRRNWIALIVVLVTLITFIHYYVTIGLQIRLEIIRSLYFIPVVLAAVFFGLSGGLLTSLSITLLYLPHTLLVQEPTSLRVEQYIAL
ncbi:MAG: hypothetical protein PHT33_05375, partial [bacterium]|nr:hypothetical protein [bacterium]